MKELIVLILMSFLSGAILAMAERIAGGAGIRLDRMCRVRIGNMEKEKIALCVFDIDKTREGRGGNEA